MLLCFADVEIDEESAANGGIVDGGGVLVEREEELETSLFAVAGFDGPAVEHDGVLDTIEIKKTAAPGHELVRVFDILNKSSVPRGKGAVICMKPQLGAIDRLNYIVPVWMI